VLVLEQLAEARIDARPELALPAREARRRREVAARENQSPPSDCPVRRSSAIMRWL
jgi:hypothetical protein